MMMVMMMMMTNHTIAKAGTITSSSAFRCTFISQVTSPNTRSCFQLPAFIARMPGQCPLPSLSHLLVAASCVPLPGRWQPPSTCLCSSFASLLNLVVACVSCHPGQTSEPAQPAYAYLISRTHPMLLPPCNCKQPGLPFGTLGSFHHISSPSSQVCSALWVHGSV